MQPMMLENLLHYPTITTGLVMAPRGIASGFAMALVAGLIGRVHIRILVGAGIVLSAWGTYMMSAYTLHSDMMQIMWPGLIQGLGMGLLFPPLSAQALMSIQKNQIAQATGLFSYGRMLGASIGISLLATMVMGATQRHWHHIAGHFKVTSPIVQQWVHQHGQLALPQLAYRVYEKASLNAFADNFYLLAWVTLALLPLVFFLKSAPISDLKKNQA
jgi:DHA2 family multidrug resistance protein